MTIYDKLQNSMLQLEDKKIAKESLEIANQARASVAREKLEDTKIAKVYISNWRHSKGMDI